MASGVITGAGGVNLWGEGYATWIGSASLFEDEIFEALPELYDTFGVSSLYRGPDGSEIRNVRVRIDRQDARQVFKAERVTGEAQTATIYVQESDIPRPIKGGRFLLRGTECWQIETTPRFNVREWVCICIRVTSERLMERRARD